MTEPVLTRHSYEARVLVVPLDARAGVSLGGPAAEALDGITVAPAAGAAARDGGAPLGAIIVTPGLRWSDPAAEPAAAALREAADTVIVGGAPTTEPFWALADGSPRVTARDGPDVGSIGERYEPLAQGFGVECISEVDSFRYPAGADGGDDFLGAPVVTRRPFCSWGRRWS